MRFVIFFYMFLNNSFKMTTCFTDVPRTTAATSKFIGKIRKGYTRKDFKSSVIWSLYENNFFKFWMN